MSELRAIFETSRPLGAEDPATVPREGEFVEAHEPIRIKRGFHVPVTVQTTETTVLFGFQVSQHGTTRKSGKRMSIPLRLYREARMQALKRVLEIVQRHKPIYEEPRVSYAELMSNQEYVEEMRVGPAIDNHEALAMYVLIRQAEGAKLAEKILAFTQVGKKITRAPWDDPVTIDPALFRSLHLIAQKELRRLGTPA